MWSLNQLISAWLWFSSNSIFTYGGPYRSKVILCAAKNTLLSTTNLEGIICIISLNTNYIQKVYPYLTSKHSLD